jgi:hypothetical protein
MSQVRGFIAAIAIAMFGVAIGLAQNSTPEQKQNIVVNEKIEQKPKAEIETKGKGKQEGIKVHGHWTIIVKNPDGRVAQHVEFENSLVGAATIASILAGQTSGGFWYLSLNQIAVFTSVGICQAPFYPYDPEQTGINSTLAGCGFLSIASSNGALNLSGTLVAGTGFTVTQVWSALTTCSINTPGCVGDFPFYAENYLFTEASLGAANGAPSLNVLAGQTVQVGLQIAFQ